MFIVERFHDNDDDHDDHDEHHHDDGPSIDDDIFDHAAFPARARVQDQVEGEQDDYWRNCVSAAQHGDFLA